MGRKRVVSRELIGDLPRELGEPRDRGWLVPAYTFPRNREDLAVLRIVVKEGFSREMADLLLADLQRHLAWQVEKKRAAQEVPLSLRGAGGLPGGGRSRRRPGVRTSFTGSSADPGST